MTNSIEIKVIHKIEDFEALREEWNRLLSQNFKNDAFLTWEWLFSWWKIFNQGKQLWLITAWIANHLVGIAPFMLEKRGKLHIGAKVLCTLGTPMNDVGGFIIQNQDPQIIDALINHILEQKKKWDILEFTEFPANGLEIEKAKSIFNRPGFSNIGKNREHYFVKVDKSWNDYYEGLSKKFRKNLRRAERNTETLGNVHISHFCGDQLLWDHINTIIDINQHAHYPRLYYSKQEQDFLRELHCRAAQWLHVFFLVVNEQPVAYEYGFLYNNCFEDWRAGFDTRIDPSISIGKLLSLNVMRRSFEQGCKEIDFMRGAHEYKTEWEPLSRQFEELRIFKHQSIPASFAYFWLKKLKPVLKRLQGSSTKQ